MAKIDVSIETEDKPAPPPKHPNTCPGCHSHYRDDELERAQWVCAQCGHHFPMRARARIASLVDEGSFYEEAADLHSEDPLGFFDLRPYTERLAEAEMSTGLAEQNLRFGHLDAILERRQIRPTLGRLLRLFG